MRLDKNDPIDQQLGESDMHLEEHITTPNKLHWVTFTHHLSSAKATAATLEKDKQAAYKQRKAAKKAYSDSLAEYKLHADEKKSKVGWF